MIKISKPVTKISKLSTTYFVSNIILAVKGLGIQVKVFNVSHIADLNGIYLQNPRKLRLRGQENAWHLSKEIIQYFNLFENSKLFAHFTYKVEFLNFAIWNDIKLKYFNSHGKMDNAKFSSDNL